MHKGVIKRRALNGDAFSSHRRGRVRLRPRCANIYYPVYGAIGFMRATDAFGTRRASFQEVSFA